MPRVHLRPGPTGRLLLPTALTALLLAGATGLRSPHVHGARAASPQDGAPETEDSLPLGERLLGLATLWRTAGDYFVHFDAVPDLDWDASYAAFAEEVAATPDRHAYYRLLQRFIGQLRDGHTAVTLPSDLRRRTARPPVRLASIGDEIVVVNVTEPLAFAMPIGTVITSVDERNPDEHAAEVITPYHPTSAPHIRASIAARRLLEGPRGSTVFVGVRRPDGTSATIPLERRPSDDAWVRATPTRPAVDVRDLGEGISCLTVRSFDPRQVGNELREALPRLVGARGLIIDLRDNGGGNSSVGYDVASHLTATPLRTSAWRTREHRGAYKAWGRGAPKGSRRRLDAENNAWFDGGSGTVQPAAPLIDAPVVVLTGFGTASAAEDFLVVTDGAAHVRRVGRPSFGSTGQPLSIDLPGGGRARICVKRDTFPDGRRFVGTGVRPHVGVPRSLAELTGAEDPTLDRGLEELRRMIDDGVRPARANADDPRTP